LDFGSLVALPLLEAKRCSPRIGRSPRFLSIVSDRLRHTDRWTRTISLLRLGLIVVSLAAKD
jgi:hypothetical protein